MPINVASKLSSFPRKYSYANRRGNHKGKVAQKNKLVTDAINKLDN